MTTKTKENSKFSIEYDGKIQYGDDLEVAIMLDCHNSYIRFNREYPGALKPVSPLTIRNLQTGVVEVYKAETPEPESAGVLDSM